MPIPPMLMFVLAVLLLPLLPAVWLACWLFPAIDRWVYRATGAPFLNEYDEEGRQKPSRESRRK